MFFASCMLLLAVARAEESNDFRISKIATLTSSLPGAGMDKPSWWGGGGTFDLRLCSKGVRGKGEPACCDTGRLNTEDDNWELGQVDWFVGPTQIKGCGDFRLGLEGLKLTLYHTGSDGGLLEWVKVKPWHSAVQYVCYVGVKLDHRSSFTTDCELVAEEWGINGTAGWCNGRPEFCSLSVDQFMWPGTHNAGTGQREGVAKCASKNQDLSVVGQLEFGIRALDLDVIFSNSLLGCHGLETGHGSLPGAGIYQCYGQVDRLLSQLREWLNSHPSELVVLLFGNIEYPEETIPSLMEALLRAFDPRQNSVMLNSMFKQNGVWPTLGQAVAANQRVLVFIRDKVGLVEESDWEFIKEVKVKPGEQVAENLTLSDPGSVTVTTSYKAELVGEDCSYVVGTSQRACRIENVSRTDFIKLSLFSRFGKGQSIGTECLYKMAKKCNSQIKQAVDGCKFRPFKPTFLLVDYPNYQGTSAFGLVDICFKENLRRAKIVGVPTLKEGNYTTKSV